MDLDAIVFVADFALLMLGGTIGLAANGALILRFFFQENQRRTMGSAYIILEHPCRRRKLSRQRMSFRSFHLIPVDIRRFVDIAVHDFHDQFRGDHITADVYAGIKNIGNTGRIIDNRKVGIG